MCTDWDLKTLICPLPMMIHSMDLAVVTYAMVVLTFYRGDLGLNSSSCFLVRQPEVNNDLSEIQFPHKYPCSKVKAVSGCLANAKARST